MRELGFAFIITSAFSVALFGVLRLVLQLDDHVAEGMAGMPFVAIHHICEMLEREHVKQAPGKNRGDGIRSLEQYGISWPVATVCGVLLFVGILAIASIYSFLGIALLGESEHHAVGALVAFFNMPVLLLGCFIVGRFTGARCLRRGIVAMLLIGLLGSILARSLDFATLSSDDFHQIWNADKSASTFLMFTASGCVIFWVPGFLGYWRGTRRRLSRYLAYVLHMLPADTRQTLVTLAWSEAQTLAARARRPAVPLAAPAEQFPAPS